MSTRGIAVRAEITLAQIEKGFGRSSRAERHAWLRKRWQMRGGVEMSAKIEERKEELGDRYILNGGSVEKWADWRRNHSTG